MKSCIFVAVALAAATTSFAVRAQDVPKMPNVEALKTAVQQKEEDKAARTSSADEAPDESEDGKYREIVARYASAYGVAASLADAVIRIESNYRPDAKGSHGEIGLMQIKPATARMMGYSGSVKGLYDPATNIKYGIKYLAMAQDLGNGSTCGTILKYNAGHAATRMNPISKRYCGQVLAYLDSAGA